jgi:erythromycin esterase
MRPLCFLLLAALCALLTWPAAAQSRTKQYVQTHLAPIASIDPYYADNADLAAFGQAIGSARIVMLGEQDHGDGATMQAKTRLVKYLHEQKGFNVLAFEGDMFSLNQGWEQLAATPDAQAAFLHDNIYFYWSLCQQCDQLLYQYVPQTTRSATPLRITGFDNQFYNPYSQQHFPAYLHAYLTKQQLPFLRSPTYQQFFRPFVDTLLVSTNFITGSLDLDNPYQGRAIRDKQAKLRRFEACLDTLTSQLLPSTSPGAERFDQLLLPNLRALAQESAAYSEDHNTTYRVRDARMAANLDWLANTKFAGEKIIVWAASAHVATSKTSDYLIQGKFSPEQKARIQANLDAVPPLGRMFTGQARNRQQTYVVGFVSHAGTSKRTVVRTATTLPPPPRNSLESWLPSGLAYAFLDWQPLRAQQAGRAPEYVAMQGLHHQQALFADWPQFFDGLFYIRTMTPCTPTSFHPGH